MGVRKSEAYGLDVQPETQFCNWQQDPYGNPIARFIFPEPASSLKITVDLIANLTVINPFDFFIEEECDQWPFAYSEDARCQLTPYLSCEEDSQELKEWVDSFPKKSGRMVDFLVEVNQRCFEKIDYLVRMEPGVQTPTETLLLGSGSCRDSAWLMVESFRKLGIAARFVSGYLIQLAADQESVDGPSGPTEDFCDLHAWVEVYLPGAGWIGLDPTSGLFAGEGHIPLACTPSYTGAAPITGGHEPCEVEFFHTMSVSRYHEDPRVTKPYTDSQWSSIHETGRRVDRHLQAGDVRLTMGGEPTFVSIDQMDDPQWNTDAVGEEKRVLSNLLLLRLRDRITPGSLLHYGQGKWYPGEPLPRWALTCLWRRDGKPIWKNDRWLADEGRSAGHTQEDAQRFVQHLALELNIDASLTFPVHEDTFHYLWSENRLPVDFELSVATLSDEKLSDPNERAKMIQSLENGLATPVGYVLPLRRSWWQAQPAWTGGRWPIRGEKLFLVPGDSPIGLRLPLDSLPVSKDSNDFVHTMPLDPTVARGTFPIRHRYTRDANRKVDGNAWQVAHSSEEPGSSSSASNSVNQQVLVPEDADRSPTDEDVIQTALCVECRHGRLHVFMPPTQRADDYLDLIGVVEQTCEALQMPVVMEGYLPPSDDRLELFKVTPDPGVIEVNTQPTSSWDDLVELTETIYKEARVCRLGTDKFDLDGRHTGTGGGNHIVLGGAKPLDSPFLRRPQLLSSLIGFWNNHPSLSYLFSGKFVGPTSQAPRFDESRRDAVYEMEIAMAQLPAPDQPIAPWLVDRLFRDLLVDLTGNTHRAEICIDKLYSPDSSTGRLGLVELRGFEMPPHPQMSLAQQLLIRSIVAAFWDQPYRRSLTDWGSSLHDRFLLPYFVREDLHEVLREIALPGLELDPAWFVPHHEFRFPKIGEVTYRGVRMELRDAIEPWNVIGEEPGDDGTVRCVDSSVERIQVQVDDFDASRYEVHCNGIIVPMRATGTSSQYVAGVRFRAWQPPRCLHPTIEVHCPLRFELVDRLNGRSEGGCTYHVVHPGGRGTDRFPINANEAESRRAARFEAIGMTGENCHGQRLPSRNGEPFPVTLDFRRVSFSK